MSNCPVCSLVLRHSLPHTLPYMENPSLPIGCSDRSFYYLIPHLGLDTAIIAVLCGMNACVSSLSSEAV